MSNSEPQATILPQAFQTMTAQDPSWNMDTGASSHLADNTCMLTSFSNSSIYPSVFVGNGKHAKLPFNNPESSVHSVFEIIHSDIWTSPIPSESGIKYYAIFLYHFSYFVWVYPLHKKSNLFDNFVAFRAYVNKQFNVDIKALQCDHAEVLTLQLVHLGEQKRSVHVVWEILGKGEGLPTWLLYNWGVGSRVDEMILARERSGFAEEKVWGDIPVVTGFWGGKEDFLGELAVWSPEDV
ncbi:ribonuclease H-like domain-containing protein [Tanacetum coccineum]